MCAVTLEGFLLIPMTMTDCTTLPETKRPSSLAQLEVTMVTPQQSWINVVDFIVTVSEINALIARVQDVCVCV